MRFIELSSSAETPDQLVPASFNTPPRARCKHMITGFLIVLWYAASIVANQTSKNVLSNGMLTTATLTLSQCVISVCSGLVVCVASCTSWRTYVINSRQQFADTVKLATVFIFGFFTLNASFASMHVSLVMVLRATEVLSTLLLGRIMFGMECPKRAKLASILVIVVGCITSVVGPHAPTFVGFLLVVASNACFSLRALYAKRITSKHGTQALPLFWQLCAIGSIMQAVVLPVSTKVLTPTNFPARSSELAPYMQWMTVLLNGVSFYAYMQLSFVVLGRISAVSHSVTNSMRRPATILAALLYQPLELTPLNVFGIVVACASSLVYALV